MWPKSFSGSNKYFYREKKAGARREPGGAAPGARGQSPRTYMGAPAERWNFFYIEPTEKNFFFELLGIITKFLALLGQIVYYSVILPNFKITRWNTKNYSEIKPIPSFFNAKNMQKE